MLRAKLVMVPLLGVLAVSSACKDEPPPPTQAAPKRSPPSDRPPPLPFEPSDTGETGEPEPSRPAVVLPERPKADPGIERTLDLISASGMRFIDPPSEPDEKVDEYTAEQFAAMLRTKWDWLGYDLIELEPWLDEIATRSFKTGLPYRVMLADGTSQELRPWLDAQLSSKPDP